MVKCSQIIGKQTDLPQLCGNRCDLFSNFGESRKFRLGSTRASRVVWGALGANFLLSQSVQFQLHLIFRAQGPGLYTPLAQVAREFGSEAMKGKDAFWAEQDRHSEPGRCNRHDRREEMRRRPDSDTPHSG